jgi:hypothetical protein
MEPTQEEVDIVLVELEGRLALEGVLRIANDLACRDNIKLDEEPLLVPFESYEALYADLESVRARCAVVDRSCFRWRVLCVAISALLVTTSAVVGAAAVRGH